MGNKKKPPNSGTDRRARVETLKREQRTKERRKTLGFILIAALVGGALIAVPVISIVRENQAASRALVSFGVPLAQAGCGPVQTDPVESNDGEHKVDPNETVNYDTAPPSHGPHFVSPAVISERGFYTPADTPRVEELVHNLEHGYTIAWYLPSLAQEQKDALSELAERLRTEGETQKFIAAPWDPARGEFPDGKVIALTHWGAPEDGKDYATSTGYRQYCGELSGAAVVEFMEKYPASDTPEPNTP